jgi:dihydroflavonol-4-reductase
LELGQRVVSYFYLTEHMKVAVTGAAGHLGSAILPELLQRQWPVRILIKDNDYTPATGSVEIIKGNLLEAGTLPKLMDGCEALIHSAAVISIHGDPTGIVHQTNVEGTRLVMQAARQAGVRRVVHISSIHAYRQRPSLEPLDESREQVGEHAFAYDRSKQAGQAIALAMNSSDMEVVTVNPTSIIGPHDHRPSKMGQVILDLCKGRLPFIFDGGFDFCDCRDVARGVVHALTMGRGGQSYLLAGKWYSFQDLVRLLAKVSGLNLRTVTLPSVAGRLGLPLIMGMAWLTKKEPLYTTEALEAIVAGNRKISSAKAIRELDYQVRPLEETLRDTFKWFTENGYLVRGK